MKKVASFREAYQAHLLRGALEAEGIPAFVQDEQLATINWVYSHAIGGVKVNVPDEFYEKALELVEQINKTREATKNILETKTGHADVCPQCGSKDIAPTRYSLWSLIPSLIFLLPIFVGRKKWQCQICGCKWK